MGFFAHITSLASSSARGCSSSSPPSLPWYALVGAQKGVGLGLPLVGSLLLALVGPTAGRYYIDLTSGKTPSSSSAASGEGVVIHGDNKPLLGRKFTGRSARELRSLGLLIERGEAHAPALHRNDHAKSRSPQ